jgi:hypothetical protein
VKRDVRVRLGGYDAFDPLHIYASATLLKASCRDIQRLDPAGCHKR